MRANKRIAVDLAIIGGGPCGIGAAWRAATLRQEGSELSYLLIEGADRLGGSSLSIKTPEGFVFDYGGHILYPHANYPAFGDLIDSVVEDWNASQPVRGVLYDGAWIPYPVQQNIHRLGIRELVLVLAQLGLVRMLRLAKMGRTPQLTENSLADYLRGRFGRGLSRLVMEPLNRKMWATEPDAMDSAWASHRSGSKVANVADVSFRHVVTSILTRKDRPGWGPDTVVRYPHRGGTGSIWESLAERLPTEHIRAGVKVVCIDADARLLLLGDGTIIHYQKLISTMPLDELVRMASLKSHVDVTSLRYASASFVGLGLKGPQPAWLRGVHSFHLPDPKIPCWRVSFPAALSADNVPDDEDAWSILCEISHNEGRDYDLAAAAAHIERSLRDLGIIPCGCIVISQWRDTLQHGYPVPFRRRDEVLDPIHNRLAALNILSRGRFGGWKYEVSNMDHTFMQGVEAVDFVVNGSQELTYRTNTAVNA